MLCKNEAVYIHFVYRFNSSEYALIRSNSGWCSISVKIIICWNRLVVTPPPYALHAAAEWQLHH